MRMGRLLKSPNRLVKYLVIFPVLFLVILATRAHGDPIVKNNVEDLDIIISQIIGSSPNVVTILDLSGSMARNYGGEQVGDWDGRDVFAECTGANWKVAFCAENIANLTICSSRTCTEDGHRCESAQDLANQLSCVTTEGSITSAQLSNIYDRICGNNNGVLNETISDCNTADERNRTAAAMEAAAGLTECSVAANCKVGTDRDPSCDTNNDLTRFRACMEDNNLHDVLPLFQPANCTGEDSTCRGDLEAGSSRMDVALNVLFNVLDADDSLNTVQCNDTGNQFNGTSSPVSCQDWMETPFRDVALMAVGSSSLPAPANSPLDGQLTNNDAEVLGVRIRPMSYAGAGVTDACSGANSFKIGTTAFTTDYKAVWGFYSNKDGTGGTPLAKILGFDNTNGGSVANDTIKAFVNEIGTDPSVKCRPEFVIVITDGDDSCSGDCAFDAASCSGTASASNNSNRRSAVQAVSNIRTYFARNPTTRQVDTDGDGTTETQTIRKEVLVFVIGLGITNPNAKRALHAMAMAGGTHTTGIIRHVDPATGLEIGSVIVDPENDDSVLPGTEGDNLEVFRALARGDGLDTTPANAWLQGCLAPNINGQCRLNSVNIFNNNYFDTGAPFTDPVENFAFLVNSPDELIDALNDILFTIEGISTSGVSPAAPQSSTAVALRDRIFLSILTPITQARLWQGRLAAYGFVDDPDNPGSKVVIRKPDGGDSLPSDFADTLTIFDDDGTLNENAEHYHWEAGKELAERDIVSSVRNLFTVKSPDLIEGDNVEDPPYSGEDFDITGNTIRYIGDLVRFDDENEPLGPGVFGIGDADVTDPIPEFCNPDAGPATACEDESGAVDCTDVSDADCIACVKGCIRDRIVDFFVGNTEIPTVADPMGQPELADQTETSMGFDCPDPEDVDEDGDAGSFDRCAVRLGDIFNSSPVIVGSPSPLFFDAGFQDFASAFRGRSAVVYVGANDGFLHAFHAGEFVDTFDDNLPAGREKNPFTLEDELFPFYDAGTGIELFGVAMPTYLPDSLATPPTEADSPAEIVFGTPPPPDYRTGDFKTFLLDNSSQRSFSDGSPVIGDVFIDGFPNGISPPSGTPEETCPSLVNSADGVVDLCGREWHTVLLAGSRNGGGAYMALDITNPACGDSDGHGTDGADCTTNDLGQFVTGTDAVEYPEHLWTLFDPDFGNTWSTPTIGRVRLSFTEDDVVKTADRWVMFVGGGADPLDIDPTDGVTFGNAFVVVDIATGKEIYKFHPDNPIPGESSAPENIDQMVCDVASRVGAFDLNADGYIDIVYFGDTCGRLWRFDVSTPIEIDGSISETGPDGDLEIIAEDWTGGIAFCANTDAECFDDGDNPAVPQVNLEPIFFAPTVASDDLGRRHVIFVTGDRRDPSSLEKSGKLYNFIDDFIPAFLAGGDSAGGATIKTATTLISAQQVIELQEQAGLEGQFTSSPIADFSSDQGEFMVIFPRNVVEGAGDEEDGEKGFGSPVVINRVLVFATFTPDSGNGDPCTSGSGEGSIFAIDFITGVPALIRIPGAQNSGILQGSDSQKAFASGVTVAQGMPTQAQLTFGSRGSVLMSVAFTGGPSAGGSQFLIWELPPFPTRTQTLFWEELL